MFTVKDYILIWTIFKLCSAFIINNDRKVEEEKGTHFKDNLNEFIKQSRNVITSLNEDILKSNKILDKIADDSNRIDRLNGFEDQQIKKIEDQLDSKALGSFGSAQLIDENVFQLNQDSNLEVDQTTKFRRVSVSKKTKISSKALQGLYRQVFSHISFQETTLMPSTSLSENSKTYTTQPVSTKETSIKSSENYPDSSTTLLGSNNVTSTKSSDNPLEAPTTQSVLNRETSIKSLENYSVAMTAPLVSITETSIKSSDNTSEATKPQPASNAEVAYIIFDNNYNDSTTEPISNKRNHTDASKTIPVSNKETSTASLEDRMRSSVGRLFLNNETILGLNNIIGSKVVPVHHLNRSHICIDLGEICSSNETQEHIKQHFQGNPDLTAKTDTSSPSMVITTVATTTRKSFYPSALTLIKPAPLIILEKTTSRPLATLSHMEFIGQITCHWVCDSKNLTSGLNETQKQVIHSSSIMNRKRESFNSKSNINLISTIPPPFIKEMGVFNSNSASKLNQMKIQQLADPFTNTKQDLCSDSLHSTVQEIQNDISFQTNYTQAGITMTCDNPEIVNTPEICTLSKNTLSTCDLPSTVKEPSNRTRTTIEMSHLPIPLSKSTSQEPKIADKPECDVNQLEMPVTNTNATSASLETLPTTERVDAKTECVNIDSIQATKVPFNFLFKTNNIINQKCLSFLTTRACHMNDTDSRSFVFSDPANYEELNITTPIRDYLFPLNKPFSNNQLVKKSYHSGNTYLKNYLNNILNSKPMELLNIPVDLRDFSNLITGRNVSPDVAKTSTENTTLSDINKNRKKKLTLPCNMEDISQYFMSNNECSTAQMVTETDECETLDFFTECEPLIVSTTECEPLNVPTTECEPFIVTTECEPFVPTECVPVTSVSKTLVTPEFKTVSMTSVTNGKNSIPSTTSTQATTKINVSTTNKKNKETTSNIKITNTNQQSSEIISTNQQSTKTTVTNQRSTETTSTHQRSTKLTSTNQQSTKLTSTNQRSTKLTSSNQQSTETISTNQQSTETISTNQRSTKLASTNQQSTETISTNQQSTETISTNQRSTKLTSTNQQSTETISTNQRSSKLTSTNQQSTETMSTNQRSTNKQSTTNRQSTEITSNTNTYKTDKHSSTDTDVPKTSVSITGETSEKTATSGSTGALTSLSTTVDIFNWTEPSKETICIPSTCPTKHIPDVPSTTVCVPVTCPEKGSNESENNIADNFLKVSPLVDVLITIPVLIEKPSTRKKSNLFRKLKYNNLVPYLHNSMTTKKTREMTIQPDLWNTSMSDLYVSNAVMSFLSNAHKKQYADGFHQKPKKPLEIFILDPNLALWRQGLKSVFRRNE